MTCPDLGGSQFEVTPSLPRVLVASWDVTWGDLGGRVGDLVVAVDDRKNFMGLRRRGKGLRLFRSMGFATATRNPAT